MNDSIMRWLQATDINEALFAIPGIERSDVKVLNGKSSLVFKTAKEAVLKGLVSSYRDRKRRPP